LPTATGLILIKKFNYRDDAEEEWSNRYWLTGVVPSSDAAWKTLADTLIGQEKNCYTPGTSVVRAYGYNNSDEHSPTVWVHDYEELGGAVAGTLLPPANGTLMAGDQAGMLSWRTARRNQRGKWVYLRKFMHDGYAFTPDSDTVEPTTLAAYGAFVLKLMDGTMPDGRILRSPLQDETLTSGEASPWVTTRTLKRRGKRPAVPAQTP
jgi:hypothetical protein